MVAHEQKKGKAHDGTHDNQKEKYGLSHE